MPQSPKPCHLLAMKTRKPASPDAQPTATDSQADSAPPPRPRRGRPSADQRQAPDQTAQNILEVATREFADKGLSGARIDAIAESTRTSKRMIYYYFTSKEGLYLAVLEDAYRRIRSIEGELKLDGCEPLEGLKRLVAFAFDYHVAHPDFVRLVMNENIHNGAFLAKSESIQQVNRSAIEHLSRLYRRGCEAGVFRTGLNAVDLHMSISALCFFTVANRHTFSLSFQRDLSSPRALAARRRSIIDMVVRHMQC